MPDIASPLKTRDQERLRFMTPLHYRSAVTQLNQLMPWLSVRKFTSYGITILLFMITITGAVQLTASLVEAQRSPTGTVVQPPAASAPPQSTDLARSAPTRLQIPSISLDTELVDVGLDENGALAVPEHDKAGWYTGAPTPGQIGPAIIDGHLDSSIYGEAVFWSLRDVTEGDTITINREDGTTVNFIVTKTASYDQHNFPTQEVYGNLDYPGLRLITCDGTFDYVTRHYSNNLVVFAKAQL